MKVLILGVASVQLDAVLELKKMGCETYAIAMAKDGPAASEADHFEVINILDVESIVQFILDNQIDAVYSTGSDIAMPVACQISERLGLPHFVASQAAYICNHKNAMRATLTAACEGNIPYQVLDRIEAITVGFPAILKPSDVLHIPGLGFDGLVGYSPIAMAKNAIGMALATEEYGAKFFANGATPGGLLEYPGTVKDPDRVRDGWNRGFSGSQNAGKVAILEEGMKYTPISIAPEQAQFLETRKFQINEIARIFRIPPHMIGDLDKSSFSNIEQQSLEFVKYTLDPWVVRWEQALSRSLFTPEEKKRYFFRFNVEGLLRGDYQSRMNGYAVARQNSWMSANDIRELENLDRIPAEDGGDLYLINGNMLPLVKAGAFANTSLTEKEETAADEQSEEILAVEKSGGRRAGGKNP